jgi:hypothetical protein
LVDLTRENADSEAPEAEVPDWLADCAVAGRARHNVDRNWKYVAHQVNRAPELVLGEKLDGPVLRYGPLGFLTGGPEDAALVRIVPRFLEQTDVEVVRFAAPGAPPAPAANGEVVEGLRRAADEGASLGRDFYDWYWSLMA